MQTNLIFFDKKVKIFIFLMIFGFLFSVLFKFHGLSINEWDNYLPSQKYISNNIIIGKSQAIRSDEWLVSTPYISSQIKHDFPKNNLNMGTNNSPLIIHYNVPVYYFTSFFKPQNYAFFFLDEERGFSFAWNYKVFGLLVSTFLLLMIFTKNNFLLSIIGSFWVYLSSFNQWWFSIPLPDLLIAFNMIVVFFAYFINSRHKIGIFLYPFGIIYFFINFSLILYPPFQVPLGYLALLLMSILLFESYKQKEHSYILLKIVVTLISLFFLGLVFYTYYMDIKEAVNIIMNTEYPGDRKLLGGGMSIAKYFSGYYDFFYSSFRFPLSYGNVCESSNFFFIFPFLIPLLLVSFLKKTMNIDYKIWLLMLYIAVMSFWVFWGFSETIAHMTLFEKVQPERALLGIGIANILVSIIFIDWLQKKDLSPQYPIEYYISLFVSLFFLGKIMQISNVFYSDTKIIISSLVFAFIAYAIYTKKISLVVFMFILLLIPSFFINPLVYGMPQFQKKELAEFVNTHNFEKKQWIAYDNIIIPMYLKALGLDVINGVNFIPNVERLKILDPKDNNKKIHNRYAHVGVKPLFDDINNTIFELKQGDLYEIHIHPCNAKIKLLDVKYFIFPDSYASSISNIKECNLHLLNNEPLNNYNVYERIDYVSNIKMNKEHKIDK